MTNLSTHPLTPTSPPPSPRYSAPNWTPHPLSKRPTCATCNDNWTVPSTTRRDSETKSRISRAKRRRRWSTPMLWRKSHGDTYNTLTPSAIPYLHHLSPPPLYPLLPPPTPLINTPSTTAFTPLSPHSPDLYKTSLPSAIVPYEKTSANPTMHWHISRASGLRWRLSCLGSRVRPRRTE